MVLDQNNTEPRHRRKRESSTSKSNKKTNHRHNYEKCLLRRIEDSKELLHLGRICSICGKVRIDNYFITKHQEDGTYLVLDNTEILNLYPNLEIKDIE